MFDIMLSLYYLALNLVITSPCEQQGAQWAAVKHTIPCAQRELQQTHWSLEMWSDSYFKAYRMSVPLLLRKSLLDFAENLKSWHVDAVARSFSCLYFHTNWTGKWQKQKKKKKMQSEVLCSIAECSMLSGSHFVTLLSNKAEMSMTIEIFENPLRAALKGVWLLIIYPSVCYLFISQVRCQIPCLCILVS